jgi:hypothetical protein
VRPGSALLLGLLLVLAGCPAPPPVTFLRTIKADDLPTDQAALEKQADEYEKSGDPLSLENSLVVRDRQLALKAGDLEVLWRASRVAFKLANDSIGDASKGRRQHFAQVGVDLAKQVIAADPKRVEGHYFYAVNIGLLATTKTVGAIPIIFDLVKHAKTAIDLDPAFEHGGPHRLLGAAQVKAPSWPAGPGDVEEGCDHLQKAVSIDDRFPMNHLLYCEALIANGKREEARKECDVVMSAPDDPEWRRELPRMRAEAERLLQRINR